MDIVSDKVQTLPPYLFAEIQRKKEKLEQNGTDVIDLGIGTPDLATPDFVVERLKEEAGVPANHRYPTYSGITEYKEAVAHFYETHYDVSLDPETEVLGLIGSKEGIAHLMQALLDPGDGVLLPDPGYPVYAKSVHLAGGRHINLPLDAANGYVPMFGEVDQEAIDRAKLAILNYPGNPTAATVDIQTFSEAMEFASENDILLAHDAAYDLITFDDYKAPSIMQVPGACDHAVEFGSLSKSFSMTGWRIAYMVGNQTVIKALATLKSNLDSGQFIPVQKAAATALNSTLESVEANNHVYKKRMETVYAGLRDLGIDVDKPRGTIFVWARVPEGYTSAGFADTLLEEAGVIVTPGNAFGTAGEGYFRIALTVTEDRLLEAVRRMKDIRWEGDN